MEQFKLLDTEDLGALASPFRRQLLDELARQPDSASGIARRHAMSRQRVGYHMRELERAGYIEVAGERPQRGLTERLYRVCSFACVHASDSSPAATGERYSWATVVNLFARGLWDLLHIRRLADRRAQRVATLGVEAQLRFATPAARKAFTEDLLEAVEQVIARHDQGEAPQARAFRLVLAAYPAIDTETRGDE